MVWLYHVKKSPYYWLRLYQNGSRESFNTKIKITPADNKRIDEYYSGKRKKKNLQGNPAVRKLMSEIKESLVRSKIEKKLNIRIVKKLTFSEGVEEYKIEKPLLKPASLKLIDWSAKRFIEICGDKSIQAYTKKDFKKFIDTISAEKQVTKHMLTTRLSSFFTFFVKQSYCAENIIQKVRAPKGIPEPIPADDLKTILQHFDDRLNDETIQEHVKPNLEEMRNVVYFMYYTGMRQSTIIDLTWDRVHLDFGYIVARNVKAEKEFNFPIHSKLRELLERIEPKNEGKIFSYTYPKMSFWDRELLKLKREGKIRKKYQMYQLRDTFASTLAAQKIDASVVQGLLNHSNVEVTKGSYLMFDMEVVKESINTSNFF